jgi:hypothetical protein
MTSGSNKYGDNFNNFHTPLHPLQGAMCMQLIHHSCAQVPHLHQDRRQRNSFAVQWPAAAKGR